MFKKPDDWNDFQLKEKISFQLNFLKNNKNYFKFFDKLETRNYLLNHKKLKNLILFPNILTIIKNPNVIDQKYLKNSNIIKSSHLHNRKIVDLSVNKNITFISKQLQEWEKNDFMFKPKFYIEEKIQCNNLSFMFYYVDTKVTSIVIKYYDEYLKKNLYNTYDIEWNLLKTEILSVKIPKPEKLNEMINFCEMFSKELKLYFVRISLFYVENKIYFSSLNFSEDNI
jgi:hypothetical protein